MIQAAITALQTAGYDTSWLTILIRVDMPEGYRGMSLEDGAALAKGAFSSQAMLNHVLEEELLHLRQKAVGSGEYGPGTARAMEQEVDEQRKFACPEG